LTGSGSNPGVAPGQTLTIAANDTFVNIAKNLTNAGTITLGDAGGGYSALRGSSLLTNSGRLNTVTGGGGNRYLRWNIANSAGGIVDFAAPQNKQDSFDVGPTTFSNSGAVVIEAGGALALSGGASFTNTGGTVTNNGAFTVSGGTFTQRAGNAITLASSTLDDDTAAGAALFALAAGTNTLTGSGSTPGVAAGTIDIGTTTNQDYGTLTSNNGTVMVESGGTLALSSGSSFAQGASATFATTINASTATFGQVNRGRWADQPRRQALGHNRRFAAARQHVADHLRCQPLGAVCGAGLPERQIRRPIHGVRRDAGRSGHTNTHGYKHTDTHPHHDADRNPDANRDPDTDPHGDAHPDGNIDSHRHSHTDRNGHSHGDTNGNHNPQRDPVTDRHRH